MILAIIITLILVLYVKIGSILPYLSYFLFGDSCRVNLKDVNSFDEYLKTLNNKKRKDLKRIIKKEYKNITIKPGRFQLLYIKSLYTFIKNKYNDIFTIIFYISLSILLFLSNCSISENSRIWSDKEEKLENQKNTKKLFAKEE